MQKVRIVTDSAASVPTELLNKYNIIEMPVLVYIGDKCYIGNEEITVDEIYMHLENDEHVKTAAPTIGQFIRAYRSIENECESIISIHINKNLSAIYETAILGAQECPDLDITVIDSKNVAMGTGMLVWLAAEAASNGKSKEEILELIEKHKENCLVYAVLPTAKYAARSGKIPAIAALFASVLSIKPILTCSEEGIVIFDKVRTFSAAVSKMIDIAAEKCKGKADYIAICHTKSRKEAEELLPAVKLKIKFDGAKLVYSEMGYSIATHGGVGFLGIAFLNTEM